MTNHTRLPKGASTQFATDWRCSCCGKLLGQRQGDSVLIRFARGHQYRAVLPVSAVCRSCRP